MVIIFIFVFAAFFATGDVDGTRYEQNPSGGLEKCFDCTLLNRYGPLCALALYDCFSCLPGYDEVPLTYKSGRHKKPCIKQIIEKEVKEECLTNKDCPVGRGLCVQEQRICVPCLDCSQFQRYGSSVCSRRVEDCGSCLPGWLEISHDSKVHFCEEMKATSAPHSTEVIEGRIYMSGIVIMGCTILFMGGVMVYFIVGYFRSCRAGNSQPATVENDLPPPYDHLRTDEGPSEFVCAFKQSADEECTARVYRAPTYNVTRVNNVTLTPVQPPEAQQDPEEESVRHDVHNEETVACPWQPNYTNEGENISGLSVLDRLPSSSAR